MMISLYVGSPLGQPFVKYKCGTEGLIAAIVAGVAGLGSAGISAGANAANVSAAADLNEENRKWQSSEAQKARNWSQTEWNRQHSLQVLDWQRQFDAQSDYGREMLQKSNDLQQSNWLQQFNMQNEYASPEAQISRLTKAGLNPALVLGGSSSSGLMSAPSTPMPSAGSSPSPSVPVPNVPNIQASTAQTFLPKIDADWATKVLDTLSSTAERLTKAGVNKQEIERSIATFSSYVQKARNEVDIQNLMKTSQSISNYISERTKDTKVGKEYSELQKLWKEMTHLGSQIEVNRVLVDKYNADADLARMQEVLAQMQSNKAFQESELLSYQVSTYYEDFTNRQNMYKAQTGAANATASAQRALAALNNANAENVSFWNGLNQDYRNELGQQIVLQTEQLSESVGLTSAQSEVARQMAVNVGKQNDYYVARFWNEMINMYVNTGVDVFSEFTKFRAFKQLGEVQRQRISNDMRKLELEEERLNKKPNSRKHERFNGKGELVGYDFTVYGD